MPEHTVWLWTQPGLMLPSLAWEFPPSGGYINGSTTIFYATNGAVVTNVDLGVSIPSKLTTNLPHMDPTHHMDTDCDWDAVGNLYYLDDWPGVWRAVSPPGPIRPRRWHCRSCKSPPPHRSLLLRASGSPTEWSPSTLPRDRAIRLRTSCCSARLPRTDLIRLRRAVITGSGGSFQADCPDQWPNAVLPGREVGHEPEPARHKQPHGHQRRGDNPLHRGLN